MACTNLCVRNINIYGSTDYGQPIYPNFCDYRTSTSRGTRFMTNPPNETISARNCYASKIPTQCIKNECKTEFNIDDEFKGKSTCQNDYTTSGVANVSRQEIGPRAGNIHYMRLLKERVFDDPPRPFLNFVTENQRAYRINKPVNSVNQIATKTSFNLQSEQADESYYFRSYQPSYSRYLDPYSTTTELTYTPYTQTMQNGVAKKDIITFYDAQNTPKGSRGFGPRVSTHLKQDTFEPIQDKLIFKDKCWGRLLPHSNKRVPHSGNTTECRSNYKVPSGKHFDCGTVEAPPLHQTPWQDLSPPSMYCTDYCHIAYKTPVDCVVDTHKHRNSSHTTR